MPVCPKSSLLDHVLVVIRTGATEVTEKLPIYSKTILRCIPNYVIYSDMEEDLQGHHIYDVLDQVNDDVKKCAPEFELYEKLRSGGRQGLDYETTFGSGPSGAMDNPGWKLDKWKFLPMVERALQHSPDAKWFVFIELDTYMVWQNMLEYLDKFDASQPYYIGKHMYIGSVLFAHGGSGFVLSYAAADKVSKHWKEHQDEYEQYTLEEWAGDMILGKVLEDVGVDLFWSFPNFQGDSLTTIDWNITKIDREPWCYAPTTFHHMITPEFSMVWEFEQNWLRRKQPGASPPCFRDIFKSLVLPWLRAERSDWDNISTGSALSPAEQEAQSSFEKCQAVCGMKQKCIQFSYVQGKCSISNELRLGRAAELQCLEYSNAAGKCIKYETAKSEGDGNPHGESQVRSGWIMNRVEAYVTKLDQSCDGRPERHEWVI
ncbi:uncharacterized protein BCR38DRAFT_356780 [Pseudomassariella vexata]|uniref:N-acetylgalactosaminide beta-1,3-galactosyltransferase n=1 Tax=Pseudomassariella vexata TaxID=1141098 RepID=A0A1Y2D8S5_9PEZI|nr:uncharacterized protein BCR38DRAFT_356780 [Pseudomassariella vexata]ORY55662.1 hypothetical protein BCR38DRAFT_356780 [Pseudomassariella vexata]